MSVFPPTRDIADSEVLRQLKEDFVGFLDDRDVNFANQIEGKVTFINDRLKLRSLTQTNVSVYLKGESGREGFFAFKSGNFTTQVASDVNEGLYIKSNVIPVTEGCWVRQFDQVINLRWFGLACNGTTDDSVPLQKAFDALPNGSLVFIPGLIFVTVQAILQKSDITFFGDDIGGFKVIGNTSGVNVNSCSNIIFDRLRFIGDVHKQQFKLAVSGAQMSESYAGQTVANNGENYSDSTKTSANFSALKVLDRVIVNFTGNDAGLNINRAVRSKPIPVSPSSRYVVMFDEGFVDPASIGAGSPKFFYDDGREWDPQVSGSAGQPVDNFKYYNYLTGTSSFTIKLGTARHFHSAPFTAIPNYGGAIYDLSKLKMYELVNEFATTNFVEDNSAYIIWVGGSNNIRFKNCFFSQLTGGILSFFCNNFTVERCHFEYLYNGVNTTRVKNVTINDCYFDMGFDDEAGNKLDQVVRRNWALAGDVYESHGYTIKDCTILRANWAIEYINFAAPAIKTRNVKFTNLNIEAAYQCISMNAVDGMLIDGCNLKLTHGLAGGIVETAVQSNDVLISNSSLIATKPYGGISSAVGPTGDNCVYKNCYMKSSMVISCVGHTNIVKNTRFIDCTIEFSGTAFYGQDIEFIFERCSVTPFLVGWFTYFGADASPINQRTINCIYTGDSGQFNNAIRDTTLHSGTTGFGYICGVNLELTGNTFETHLNTPFGFYGSLSTSTSRVNVISTNNTAKWGYYFGAPSGMIQLSNVPAVGGDYRCDNNSSGDYPFAPGAINSSGFLNGGNVVRVGGIYGGGKVNWTPGDIPHGSSIQLSTPISADFNCSVSIIAPYNLQGCTLSGYSDGSAAVLVLTNNTGSTKSFGFGSFKVTSNYQNYGL